MINSLQSFRFLFALMIFAHHFFIPQIEPFGSFPVAFFFILSGFVMTLGYWDRVSTSGFNYKQFMQKRLTRLLPLNILCLLLYFLLPIFYDIVSGDIHWGEFKYLIVDTFLLQSWIPLKEVYFSGNAVAWFLSDILFFYILFPPLVLRFKKLNVIYILVSILSLYLIVIQFVPSDWVHPLIYINPLFRIVDFIIGMVLALLMKPTMKEGRSSTFLQLFSLCIAIASLLIYSSIPIRYSYASLYWIPSLLIIVAFSWGGHISNILGKKILVYLGSLSFPFYMMHFSIIIWWRHIENHLAFQSQIIGAIFCLSLLLLMSHCYVKYLEPRIVKKLQGFI